MSIHLFKTATGYPSSTQNLTSGLRNIGAHDCDVLFLHSGMNFGLPNVPRKELLSSFWEAINNLGIKTLCVPVFTFSFPNNEIYDIQNTPSRMGVFGEYVRKLPGTIRSHDPMMSVALLGKQKDLVCNIGNESCGEASTFHKLSQRDGVKFAFLGVRAGACFTYMHHLEWQANVPYRYNRTFHGRIRNTDIEKEETAILNVRYNNVVPNFGSYKFEDIMVQQRKMKKEVFGDGNISCVSANDAATIFLELLQQNPNFFITNPFESSNKDKTFQMNGIMSSM